MTHRLKARFGTFVLFFILGFAFSSWASRIPDIQEKLHLSVSQLGGVLLGMPIGSILSVFVTGYLIETFGSRLICLWSAIFSGTVLVSLGYAPTPLLLTVGLAFFGAADNILNIAMNTQAIGVEALYKKTLMSTFHAVWSLGAMGGAAAGGFFATYQVIPLSHFLIVFGFMTVSAFSIFAWLIQSDPKTEQKQPLFALPDKSLWVLSAICLCGMMSEGAMADWSALFYKSTLTNKTSSPTMGYTAFAFAMSVVRFTGDWFINKVGTFKTLIISGLLMSLGLLIALGFAVSYAVIIGFGLVGAGVACVVPIVYSTAGKSKTMSAGMAIAAVSTIGYTGFLVGPPIIGFIAEATSLRFSLGIVILLGLLIVLLTKKVQA